jgi:hypothetical protein
MRFDLFGFSIVKGRKPSNKGFTTKMVAFFDGYLNALHVHLNLAQDPLNPFKRRNFSLVMIRKDQHLWHVELLGLILRNDHKKLAVQQYLKAAQPKFSKRVKAMARGKF